MISPASTNTPAPIEIHDPTPEECCLELVAPLELVPDEPVSIVLVDVDEPVPAAAPAETFFTGVGGVDQGGTELPCVWARARTVNAEPAKLEGSEIEHWRTLPGKK